MSVIGVILARTLPAFSRIRTEYGEILRISPYPVRMRENAGKMRTRITPNTDTFYAEVYEGLFSFWFFENISSQIDNFRNFAGFS